jgi:hypothetical protein
VANPEYYWVGYYGFDDLQDYLLFKSIHGSWWYDKHQGESCFDKRYIDEYKFDRGTYLIKCKLGERKYYDSLK